MIEKFNNIYYLLIYVIHFAGIGIYAFQTIFRTRQFCTKFEIDDSGYRLIFNTNDDGGQTVYHIHLHLIGGEKLKAF